MAGVGKSRNIALCSGYVQCIALYCYHSNTLIYHNLCSVKLQEIKRSFITMNMAVCGHSVLIEASVGIYLSYIHSFFHTRL